MKIPVAILPFLTESQQQQELMIAIAIETFLRPPVHTTNTVLKKFRKKERNMRTIYDAVSSERSTNSEKFRLKLRISAISGWMLRFSTQDVLDLYRCRQKGGTYCC